MQLDLTSFKYAIDPTILQRGQKYFMEGHVINLEELVKGHWYAEVAGSEVYEVELTLARTIIKHFDCSCPYDQGPVCKHVAAVLYALQKNQAKTGKGSKNQATLAQAKVPAKKAKLQEILDTVSYSELKTFLLEYALKKNEFGGVLLARFAEQTGVEGKEKYVLIIKNAVNAAAGRNRFIEYHHVAKVMKPVKELLQQAHTLYGRKYYAEVVSLCQAIIEELSELVQKMDDSGGHATRAIEAAFKLLLQISEDPIPVPLQQTLFAYALAEVNKPQYRYNGSYLFWYELLDKLAQDESREKQVIALVQSQLEQQSQTQKALYPNERMFRNIIGNYYIDYVDERQLVMYLVNFYLKRNRQPEADSLIQEYRHIPQFREIIVKKAVKDQQFSLAKQHIQEALAIERSGKSFGQNDTHWTEWLLRIAEAEGDEAEVRSLAAALLYKNYHLNYYRKYKQTFSPENWPAEYDKLVKKVINDGKGVWHARGKAVPVFIEEKDWTKLFDYVSKNPSLELLLQTSQYLQPLYGKKILELFRNALFSFAETNVNKASYEFITEVLQHMLTIEGGKPIVTELLAMFRELFPKRRSMMVVLNKVRID